MDDDVWLDDQDDAAQPRRSASRQTPPSWETGYGAPPARRTSPVVILLLVFGVVLSLSAVGVIVYVAMDRLGDAPVAARRSWGTLSDESYRVYSDFDSQDPLKDLPAEEHPIRDEILDLLSRLEEFTEAPEPANVADIVDLKRLAARVELTGGLATWGALDKAQLRSQLVDFAINGIEPGTMTLAGFVRVKSDPQTRVAYVYAVDSQTGETTEVRLWMAPAKDGQWKLYDWERLDVGISESTEIGIYCRYAETPRLDSYFALSDHLDQADIYLQQYDSAAAAEELKLAEGTTVVAELADFCHLLTGYRWQQADDYKKARACFERIQQPERTPGAFIGLLNCSEYDDDETALKNAIQYELCVGPSLNLCQRKAQILERLDRHKEAIPEWQKVLRIDAGSSVALAALLKDFSDDNKSDLSPYLDRLDDPTLAVIQVVNYLDWDDQASRKYLLDFVRSREPDSARCEIMVAGSLQAAGQLEQAAEHYEVALSKEQDEDSQADCVYEYLNLMLELGRILEATQRVPEKSEAYDSLLTDHVNEDIFLSKNEYLEISRRYYDEYPSNGWAAYYRALAIYEADTPEDTIEILKKCLTAASDPSIADDEYLESAVQSLLATAQLAAGQDATTLLAADQANFSELTGSALADERWPAVEALIAARSNADANDLDLLRLQGNLAVHEQRWNDAIIAFSAAIKVAKADSDRAYLTWQFLGLLRTAYLNSGQWKSSYEEQEDKRQGYNVLARMLISRRDWSTFRELTKIHQQAEPSDAQIPQLKSEVEWLQADYEACAESCEAARASSEADDEHALSEWQLTGLRNRHLACLLELKRYPQANKLAQQILKDHKDAAPLVIVAAAMNDEAETRRQAIEVFERDESLTDVYSHPQAGPFILQKQFADLHEKSPVEIFYVRESDKAVLLFDKPPTLDTQLISKLVKEIAPEEPVTIEEFETSDPRVTSAVAVRLRDCTIQLVSANARSDDWKLKLADPQLAPILEGSAGSLTISKVLWSGNPPRETPIARMLALRLSTDSTGVIVLSDWLNRFVRADSPGLETWAATTFLSPEDFPEVHAKELPDRVELDREFQTTLRKLVLSELSETPAGFEIECLIGNGRLSEPIWIEVSEASHVSYGSCDFQGVLKSASRVLPTFREGLKVSIDQWQVRAWRQHDGPIHLHPDHPGFPPPQE